MYWIEGLQMKISEFETIYDIAIQTMNNLQIENSHLNKDKFQRLEYIHCDFISIPIENEKISKGTDLIIADLEYKFQQSNHIIKSLTKDIENSREKIKRLENSKNELDNNNQIINKNLESELEN